MSNIPTNMRAFDLELAKQGHPICTRDDTREVKFLMHVPEVISTHQIIVKVNDEVVRYNTEGKIPGAQPHWHLFLAPLGYCEGKPVFAGDELTNVHGNSLWKVGIGSDPEDIKHMKWPSQKPVVETRMTEREILEKYTGCGHWPTRVANGAIARSIADGDVIPTEVAEKLMREVCDYPNSIVPSVLNKYKESLK